MSHSNARCKHELLHTFWILASVSASTEAVASSIITTLAPVNIARAMTRIVCFTWCNIAPGRNTWNSTISTWCNIAPGSRSCHIQKLAKLSASLQQSQDGLSAKTQEAKSLRSELSKKEDTIKESSSVDLDVRQETEITNTGQAYRSCHPLWYWYTVKVLLLIFVMMLVPPALYY
jgi:hypothetical protein